MATDGKGAMLTTDPADKLIFNGPFEDGVTTVLKIKNESGKKLCFKVKCTSNELFKIRPVMGILDTGASADVNITFTAKDKKAPTASHHFTLSEIEPKEGETVAKKIWEAEEAKKLPSVKKIPVEFKEAAGGGGGEEKKEEEKKEGEQKE